ncbi:MAG: hypothetical protein WD824_05655 [Cyclobacteriaceae bacterium]
MEEVAIKDVRIQIAAGLATKVETRQGFETAGANWDTSKKV